MNVKGRVRGELGQGNATYAVLCYGFAMPGYDLIHAYADASANAN